MRIIRVVCLITFAESFVSPDLQPAFGVISDDSRKLASLLYMRSSGANWSSNFDYPAQKKKEGHMTLVVGGPATSGYSLYAR